MIKNSAVFLDRDDTIVKSYGTRPANSVDEIELLPLAAEGIAMMQELGYLIVVVSNQGGIGLGYITNEVMRAMNARLDDLLIQAGVRPIDAYYWCPHAPAVKCECRKPRPGMILSAAQDLYIDLPESHLVGDDVRDLQAASKAGILSVFHVRSTRSLPSDFRKPPASVDNLLGAAKYIRIRRAISEIFGRG